MSTPVLISDCVFVVTANQCYEKIAKNDILYVQAEGAWVDIITVDKTFRLSTNLGAVELQLDAAQFTRVSRKHIVNIHHIGAVQGNDLRIMNEVLTIGRQYRDALMRQLPILWTNYRADKTSKKTGSSVAE
ncbi:LytR/AlgR family response regulator transcription factor [Fibrella arboris]|uniref:LytR/AlgR family response regulator transcription factor n=1 Tax=Fibrella arboris TaxID=3242486 RepID=UPI0035200631